MQRLAYPFIVAVLALVLCACASADAQAQCAGGRCAAPRFAAPAAPGPQVLVPHVAPYRCVPGPALRLSPRPRRGLIDIHFDFHFFRHRRRACFGGRCG